MRHSPLVSVVMPAYNSARYIRTAIESVLSQTWQRWELIVVNDGSTDETGSILRDISDNRVIVLEQPNRGVSAARNKGLDRASGEFVTFMDSDDILPPASLEVRAQFLQDHPGVDIVDGKIISKDESLGNVVRVYSPYYKGRLLPRLLALDDRVFFGTVYMLRRDLLAGISFPESMSHAEDLLFFTLVADKNDLEYAFVEEEVYHYRTRGDSATSNIAGLQDGYLAFMGSVFSAVDISLLQKMYLKLKVSKIMFLTWMSEREYRNAIASVYKCVSSV